MPKVIDIQKIIIFTRIALNGFVDWSSGKRNEDEKGVGVGLVINDPLFGFLYRLVVFSRETNDKEGLEADPDLPANLSCHGVGFNCLALVDDLHRASSDDLALQERQSRHSSSGLRIEDEGKGGSTGM